MNFSYVSRPALTACILFLPTLLLPGCSSDQGSLNAGPSVATDEGKLVFDMSWSETGHFSVYQYANGVISSAVTGIIGKDDHIAVRKALHPASLTDTYLALRPGESKAPEILATLDKLIPPYKPTNLRPVELPKTGYDDFMNTECVNFCDTASHWVPYACTYTYSVTTLSPGPYYNSGDLNFYWNDSGSTSHHTIWDTGVEYGNTEAAYSWGYRQYYDSALTNAYYSLTINQCCGATGNLGLTVHHWVSGPC
jgi:hypothetical protein